MNCESIDLEKIVRDLGEARVVPYLGPGALALCGPHGVPSTPPVLCAGLTRRVGVPHKIRSRLTQAAQFIENFKHRKTLVTLMNEAFAATAAPSALHLALARCAAPLVVDTWYDDTMLAALRCGRPQADWGQVQALAQSEHFGTWTQAYDAAGTAVDEPLAAWCTLLYRPIGGRSPAGNYLVSDSDFVEVLTEIDIQTPIPARVQELRKGRSFLFLGCRFDDQLTRAFARQIMKRSSATHWAVLPETPTRMEARFLQEQGIVRIEMPLAQAAQRLFETACI